MMKRLRAIARAKGAEMTTVARHSEVPERTAYGAIRDAEGWKRG